VLPVIIVGSQPKRVWKTVSAGKGYRQDITRILPAYYQLITGIS
jgi:hypothetical protein